MQPRAHARITDAVVTADALRVITTAPSIYIIRCNALALIDAPVALAIHGIRMIAVLIYPVYYPCLIVIVVGCA